MMGKGQSELGGSASLGFTGAGEQTRERKKGRSGQDWEERGFDGHSRFNRGRGGEGRGHERV